MSDYRHALEFIEAAERCASVEELQGALRRALEPFGVSQFTLLALARHPKNGARLPVPLSHGSTEEWRDRYIERSYYNSDIIIHSAIQHSAPFTWDNLDLKQLKGSARTVFNEGREIMGVEGSLVIPTHDAQGFAGFISLFCEGASPHPSAHRALKLMSIYALEKAKELHGLTPDRVGWDKPCPLTPRQRETLAFIAKGKTAWEIGEIMGITERTANHHIDAVKRQLDVATSAQAVARAIHSGWIAM